MTNPTTITAPPALPFIDIVREFDAPVHAVFRAHTDPDLPSEHSQAGIDRIRNDRNGDNRRSR